MCRWWVLPALPVSSAARERSDEAALLFGRAGGMRLLRAALYARVSTEEQASEGASIPAQKKLLHEYATRHQLELVAEFVDEGVSARSADRPQFQRMVAAARQKPRPFDVILIHKTDRFARNREDAIVYKSLLRRECGIEVLSITEQFEDSPTGKLLEGIMEVMAEFYSLNLSQEVKKGMRELASQGRALGMAPFGYRIGSDGKLVVEPEEAEVVRWLFHTYNAGDDGLLALARRLISEGPVRFGPAATHGKWSAQAVRGILTNPTYIGSLVWNRRDSSSKRRLRAPEEWVVREHAHAAIVDAETFAAAGRLLRSRRGAPAAAGNEYLLRGVVRCLDCSGAMVHYRMQWRRADGSRACQPQLVCSRYQNSRRCYFNHAPLADVEAAVTGCLHKLLSGRIDPDSVEVSLSEDGGAEREQAALQRQLVATGARLRRQLEAFEAGAITLDDLKAARARVEGERTELQRRVAALQAQQAAADAARDELQQRIAHLLSHADRQDLSMTSRRAALSAVIHSLAYSRQQDRLRIVLKV